MTKFCSAETVVVLQTSQRLRVASGMACRVALMLHATALPSCTESQQELLHPLVLYDCGAAVTDPVPVISMLPGLNSKFVIPNPCGLEKKLPDV